MLMSYICKTLRLRLNYGCAMHYKRACSTTTTTTATRSSTTTTATTIDGTETDTAQPPESSYQEKAHHMRRRRRTVPQERGGRAFIDWKIVHVCAGKGGNGMASFMNTRAHNRGPHGGDGGDGGNVFIRADENLTDLNHLKGRYRAEPGGKGEKHWKRGKTGKSITFSVPVGTTVTNTDTEIVMADLVEQNQEVTLLHGGMGGLGNDHFKRPDHVRPTEFTEGEQGEEAFVEIELKSIADIGLVGFPNAGKSTLLSALSRAKPKIASYPFTTLRPNLGVIMYEDNWRVKVADIPGLIKGAHLDKGLGHYFLRHVERCRGLIYVVDFVNNDCLEQYGILKQELDLYSNTVSSLPSLLVANKADLCEEESEEVLGKIRSEIQMPVIAVSAKYGHNIEKLREQILDMYRS